MFSFNNVVYLDDQSLSCNCTVTKDLPFFNGHFSELPLMPAVAQLEMLQTLILKHTTQRSIIIGGDKLKFNARIQPNDVLTIQLNNIASQKINFSIINHGSLAAKGTLRVMENNIDP